MTTDGYAVLADEIVCCHCSIVHAPNCQTHYGRTGGGCIGSPASAPGLDIKFAPNGKHPKNGIDKDGYKKQLGIELNQAIKLIG